MKRRERECRILRSRAGWRVVATALLLLVAATPALAQKPRTERPTYEVGDQWLLKDGVYELIKVEKDRYVFAAGPNRQIHLTKDLGLASVLKDRVWEWDIQPAPRLTWPLEVGKWGTTPRAIFRNRDHPSGVPVQVTWEVKAYEDVQAGGSTFKAFQILYAVVIEAGDPFRRRPDIPGAQSWYVAAWYVPEVQRIVKVDAPTIAALNLEIVPRDRPAVATVPAPPAVRPSEPASTPSAPESRPAAPAAPAGVPLQITMSYPEERSRLTDESTVAAAVASSGQGVTEVVVILNGSEVLQQRERSPRKSVAIAAPIKLREGANTIVVRATQADGAVVQEVRSVTYERSPPPAGAPPVKVAVDRDRWAVVIGVGRYKSPEIPSLRYSVADAEAVYQLLIERARFKKENVLLLTDTSERKPTLRDMKWALGTFLARSAKKDDLVLIFYAGHGAPEIDPRGAEPDGLAKYLVPVDADPQDLYSTALPMDELQIIFDRIEAERVVVFLDACYSGAAGGRTFASKRTRAVRVDDVFLDRLARSRGRAIITASRASEVSLELPELGHGLFTHYLLQGLHGAADLDRNGMVELHELYTYLEQQVTRRSRAIGGNQHPVMKGEVEGLLPLVRVSDR